MINEPMSEPVRAAMKPWWGGVVVVGGGGGGGDGGGGSGGGGGGGDRSGAWSWRSLVPRVGLGGVWVGT